MSFKWMEPSIQVSLRRSKNKMVKVSLEVDGLGKSFNRRKVFGELRFCLKEPESLMVTGRNGSGKSTLLKILAGVLKPSAGNTLLSLEDKPVSADVRYCYVGLVAPYLQLYEAFSAL